MNDIKTTSAVIHPNNLVGGCYVWRENQNPVWVNVHVGQASSAFPEQTLDGAIRKLAIDIFKMREDLERKTASDFTGYN